MIKVIENRLQKRTSEISNILIKASTSGPKLRNEKPLEQNAMVEGRNNNEKI